MNLLSDRRYKHTHERSKAHAADPHFPIPDALQGCGKGEQAKSKIKAWLSAKLKSCDLSTQEKVLNAYLHATSSYGHSHRFHPQKTRPSVCSLSAEALMHIMPAVALNADDRFTLLESIIKACHIAEESEYTSPRRFSSTFDRWNGEKENVRKRIRDEVVKYYSALDFIKRYHLGCFAWINDADIKALLQALQTRGRAKAALRLEKLEQELGRISEKISKLESNGRYYREDKIKLTVKFDMLEFEVYVCNDRPKKRQERIEKIAAAPGKAAEAVVEGTLIAADKAIGFGCALFFILGFIGCILALLGVVK